MMFFSFFSSPLAFRRADSHRTRASNSILNAFQCSHSLFPAIFPSSSVRSSARCDIVYRRLNLIVYISRSEPSVWRVCFPYATVATYRDDVLSLRLLSLFLSLSLSLARLFVSGGFISCTFWLAIIELFKKRQRDSSTKRYTRKLLFSHRRTCTPNSYKKQRRRRR